MAVKKLFMQINSLVKSMNITIRGVIAIQGEGYWGLMAPGTVNAMGIRTPRILSAPPCRKKNKQKIDKFLNTPSGYGDEKMSVKLVMLS